MMPIWNILSTCQRVNVNATLGNPGIHGVLLMMSNDSLVCINFNKCNKCCNSQMIFNWNTEQQLIKKTILMFSLSTVKKVRKYFCSRFRKCLFWNTLIRMAFGFSTTPASSGRRILSPDSNRKTSLTSNHPFTWTRKQVNVKRCRKSPSPEGLFT